MNKRVPIMYHDGSIWRFWECYNQNNNNNVAILVGGGPSLNKIDISKLKGPKKTIFGLNNTYPKVSPDYWIGMDMPQCYDSHLFYEAFPKIMRGNYYNKTLNGRELWEYPNSYFAAVKQTKRQEDLFHSIGKDTEIFVWHKNVFMTAINIILYMGFNKIYLAGVDFSLDEQDYFNPQQVLTEKQRTWNSTLYSTLYKYVEWLYNTGKYSGIDIYSISPESKINTFLPYITLEELNTSLPMPKKTKLLHSSEFLKD